MGKLIHSMATSLDGFVSDSEGRFGWAAPDEEVHEFVNEQFRSIGTNLYGRRMYETMVYWETAHAVPDQPPFLLEFARLWQATDKIVYSTTLNEVSSERTRIEPSFDPDVVRRLKAESDRDIAVEGPHLAAQAIQAGLVDEYQSSSDRRSSVAVTRSSRPTSASSSSCSTSGDSATAWSTCATASKSDQTP